MKQNNAEREKKNRGDRRKCERVREALVSSWKSIQGGEKSPQTFGFLF